MGVMRTKRGIVAKVHINTLATLWKSPGNPVTGKEYNVDTAVWTDGAYLYVKIRTMDPTQLPAVAEGDNYPVVMIEKDGS
jgi:hypothetical protein